MNSSALQPFSTHKEAKMNKILTAAIAAITLGGAVTATAADDRQHTPVPMLAITTPRSL